MIPARWRFDLQPRRLGQCEGDAPGENDVSVMAINNAAERGEKIVNEMDLFFC